MKLSRAALLMIVTVLPWSHAGADELKRRGFFGARTVAVDSGTGARISEVLPGGVAASAGLRVNDTITALNGKKVNAPNAFEAAVRPLKSGEKVSAQVQRDGKPLTVDGVFAEAPRESYAAADVIYDSVAGAKNQRLRSIITKPKNAPGKLPVIFVAGWLSDDSIEAPNDTKDPAALVLRGLAELPGFATLRVDKPGAGDSDGNCAETDFDTELAGYRAAFAALSRYDFIDPNRIFIIGMSNGGGFAPLVPPTTADLARVRGFITIGGWAQTWFEHMLEIERNRLTLDGQLSQAEINAGMRELAGFYSDMLLKGDMPRQIFPRRPAAAKLWPGDDDAHLYGRPIAFFQQLQKVNLADAWSKVAVPTLVLHGQFDWIMSRENSELIATIVSKQMAGLAEFVELPNTGHTLQSYPTMTAAFRDQQQPFNPAHLKRITTWLSARRGN